MFFYPYNAQKIVSPLNRTIEKFKNRILGITDILDDDDALNDLKFASSSQIISQ